MLGAIKNKILQKNKRIRETNELFSSGEIFAANNEELDNVLKEITVEQKMNNTTNQEIIRAITVLNIKNARHAENVQYFNIYLSIFIIALSVWSIILAKQQTDYTEISTRSERITQNQFIRNGLEKCKKNPESLDSGLFFEDGRLATCVEILKSIRLRD